MLFQASVAVSDFLGERTVEGCLSPAAAVPASRPGFQGQRKSKNSADGESQRCASADEASWCLQPLMGSDVVHFPSSSSGMLPDPGEALTP